MHAVGFQVDCRKIVMMVKTVELMNSQLLTKPELGRAGQQSSQRGRGLLHCALSGGREGSRA